jgi:transcriptional antiterminator
VFECFLYRIKRKENEVSRQLTLLSKKLQRQLRLLEILFEGKKYRFGDLEVMLDCSSKTLRTDLAEINTYAKGIEILMERESGVSAAISSHITEDYIYRIIMEESLEFRYLEAILLKNYEDYFTLAEGLFVSESTLRRIAAKVRTLLKDYHLTIQGLIKLSGDDQLITELTIQFLSEKYHYFENAFPIHFCQWIEKLVQDFLSENKLEEQAAALDSKEQQMLHFLVASRLLQIEKGMLSNQKKAKQNFQFKKILEKKLHLPITDKLLNKELLDYIFDPTMIYPVLGSKESNLSFSSSSKIVENIDSFIRKLERKYQLINEDRAKTRQKIIYRLNCQEIPSYLLYDKNQSILNYVQPET